MIDNQYYYEFIYGTEGEMMWLTPPDDLPLRGFVGFYKEKNGEKEYYFNAHTNFLFYANMDEGKVHSSTL